MRLYWLPGTPHRPHTDMPPYPQMIVIRHQTIGVTRPALAGDFPLKEHQKRLPVGVIDRYRVDIGAGIASALIMVEGAGEFQAELLGYRAL